MPLLDVSFMCQDAMLADTFAVQRRLNTMGSNGRVVATAGTLYPTVKGVVTQQDPADLMRTEDGQSVPKRIFLASSFQLMSATLTNQPDEITWNGIVYTVQEVFPYSQFGKGIYEAIAVFRGTIPAAQ